jgi:methylthioribose-1-phosphate isomerase
VWILDQTRLPGETVYLDIDSIEAAVEAIAMLRIRGAPLIGVGAAMSLAAAAKRAAEARAVQTASAAMEWVESAAARLAAARPTAVNLGWAMTRMIRRVTVMREQLPAHDAGSTLARMLREEAQRIWDEDAAMCGAIGRAGAALIPPGTRALTVCNTGMLATGGIGTAFGVLRTAFESGVLEHVYACETRPLRQGARLTAWELARCDMPGTVIVDGAAAPVMASGRVDVVIAGADRIAANGDSANKVGTLGLAMLARVHGLPFYIAAPTSTIDPRTATGAGIPIEERGAHEIGVPNGVSAFNPAFDVTPAGLITAIITDRGVLEPPYERSISEALSAVAAR